MQYCDRPLRTVAWTRLREEVAFLDKFSRDCAYKGPSTWRFGWGGRAMCSPSASRVQAACALVAPLLFVPLRCSCSGGKSSRDMCGSPSWAISEPLMATHMINLCLGPPGRVGRPGSLSASWGCSQRTDWPARTHRARRRHSMPSAGQSDHDRLERPSRLRESRRYQELRIRSASAGPAQVKRESKHRAS